MGSSFGKIALSADFFCIFVQALPLTLPQVGVQIRKNSVKYNTKGIKSFCEEVTKCSIPLQKNGKTDRISKDSNSCSSAIAAQSRFHPLSITSTAALSRSFSCRNLNGWQDSFFGATTITQPWREQTWICCKITCTVARYAVIISAETAHTFATS